MFVHFLNGELILRLNYQESCPFALGVTYAELQNTISWHNSSRACVAVGFDA